MNNLLNYVSCGSASVSEAYKVTYPHNASSISYCVQNRLEDYKEAIRDVFSHEAKAVNKIIYARVLE